MEIFQIIGSIVGTIFVFGYFGFVIFSILKEVGNYALNKKDQYTSKCSHGVRQFSGCYDCSEEERIKYEKLNVEHQKKEKFKRAAKKKWNSEFKKVKSYYTSRIENLKKISPREFEATIERLYKKLGYETELTSYVGDEGKDIIASKNKEKYFIECKQFCQNNKVSRPYLQKLFGAMSEHKISKGILVTTSEFTKPAIEYSKRVGIELINKIRLRQMFQEAYGGITISKINLLCEECGNDLVFSFYSNKAIACSKCKMETENELNIHQIERILNAGKNECKKCGGKLIKRDGINGKFYGCENFPDCNYTENYSKNPNHNNIAPNILNDDEVWADMNIWDHED